MEIIRSIIQIIAGIAGSLAAMVSIVLFLQFRWPNAAVWGLKIFSSAFSPVFVLVGLLTFITGFATGSVFISVVGIYVVFIYVLHIIRITRPPASESSFEQAFGLNWKKQIKPWQKKYFLPYRTVLKLPAVPEPRLEQNISFATIPGTGRDLLCDIWQPPETISPSGLAFIFMHGSAFYILDKDCGTRPFFRHLAAQGHVIMDVAYRLAPETDLMGMINDVKRAIVWMKDNAVRYEADPFRIVPGGGSAGGFLALMAAYTINDERFTPVELKGKDISCCGVIGIYPATDLEALYYHTNQHLTTRIQPGRPKKRVPAEMPAWIKKRIGKDFHRLGFDKGFENVGTMAPLMGGHPDECPERYDFFSPVNYVNSKCPPTLLIQGAHDIMAPVRSTKLLYDRLIEEKVPAILHILPQADHAFDLLFPAIAPAAHTAFYDVERFMALSLKPEKPETITEEIEEYQNQFQS
ncbi:MAG TPA: alpha/beta hydrolase [Chitinophagaceae bacterium]|jgi:acetyl esterase/lipase|nr:alpha/beta hydrolase [Chitinophagaceae bacterium]